jgi:glycosyltransferase involved in cell wall biosynthesis
MKIAPILFLSDSVNTPTGLGRITKDLAVLTSTLPEFRVGTMGRGGQYTTKLPFAQYSFDENYDWGATLLESVWDDFAGNVTGVIMTIWDPSRLSWFSNPMMGGRLEQFLRSGRFQRWGYFPVDSYGIGNKLTGQCIDTIARYDRVLAYTLFGKQVLENSLNREVDWIPHGYNEKIFQPRDRVAGRGMLGVNNEDIVCGIVMTNQARKDWATALGAIAFLKNEMPTIKLWAHIDVLERYWSLPALINDFGLTNTVILTFNGQYTSEQLSYLYSCCDITMLPSTGEGWGFPLVESMACGVPAIHGNYGGGAELLPSRDWLVDPVTERLDGQWNCVRPVWNPKDWADKLKQVLAEDVDKETCTNAVSHLMWSNLYVSCWRPWFLGGLK